MTTGRKSRATWAALGGWALACAGACADGGQQVIYIYGGGDGSPDALTGGTSSAGTGGSAALDAGPDVATGGAAGTAGTAGIGATGGTGAFGGTSGTGASGGAAGTGAFGGTAGVGAFGGTGGTGGGDCENETTCQPNDICTVICGKCGQKSRLCDSTGAWLPWSACINEGGECTVNEQKLEQCGKCGERTLYCSNQCQWLPGPCENEGSCDQGALQTITASCPAGEIRVSVCDAACTWGPYSECGKSFTWTTLPASPLSAREEFGHVWTGSRWFIVGGYGTDLSPSNKEDAASYDAVARTWELLPAWPSGTTGRRRNPVVFSGGGIITWGGEGSSPLYKDDGLYYSTITSTWSYIPNTGAPTGRYGHAAVWDDTGKRMIVWGGHGSTPTYKDDGARYDPNTGQWTPLPASLLSARRSFAYAWDPARRWLYVFGGIGSGTQIHKTDGAIFDASVDAWRMLPPVPSDFDGRYELPGAVAGGKFVVWGGRPAGTTPKADGLVYDPVGDAWSPMPAPPIAGRSRHAAAASGSRVFYFGGDLGSSHASDAAIFDVAQMTWIGTTPSGLSGREQLGAAWTSQGILVWGGYGTTASPTFKDDGATYVP